MNNQETVKIITIIKTAYPRYYVSTDQSEIKLQIETWQNLFTDEPFVLVEQAVKALICTLKFPPTIADVKEKIQFITQPKAMTEMEAWGTVLTAIQDSYYNASEQFGKLTLAIQKIIGSPNQLRIWGQMDFETVNSVIQSNFMRSFKSETANEKEYESLPASTKQMIENSKRKELTE